MYIDGWLAERQLLEAREFRPGDRVRIELDADIFAAMQDGHGGCNAQLLKVRKSILIESL